MMEWSTFVEFNKMMLIFVGGLFVVSLVSGLIYRWYNNK